MKRLHDLLHSITAVIIRYHDSNAKDKLIIESDPTLLQKKSLELSIERLSQRDFESNLKELVKQCTEGYDTRKPFLSYLIHEVTFIKSILDRTTSFNALELAQYKQQMAQILLDFKHLLLTNKSDSYKVTYSKLSSEAATTISISGLKNDGYFGNKLCHSGDLIAALLAQFHFDSNSPDKEMVELIEDMCQEHQNSLLVPELSKSLKVETDKVTTLTDQQDTLKLNLAAQKLELERALTKIKELEEATTKVKPQTSTTEMQVSRAPAYSSFFHPLNPLNPLSPLRFPLQGTFVQQKGKIPNSSDNSTASHPL